MKITHRKIAVSDKKRLEEMEHILRQHGKKINILSKSFEKHIEETTKLLKSYRDGTLEANNSIKQIHEKIC